MNPKVVFFVLALSLAILVGCAGKVGPSPTVIVTPEPTSTSSASLAVQLAQEYFSAIQNGDAQGAKALLVPGARCTPGDLWTKVDSQLASLASAEIRGIEISEKDISQIVEIYAPDAQAACVAFEYRKDNGSVWSPANVCVVIETGICDTWFTEE